MATKPANPLTAMPSLGIAFQMVALIGAFAFIGYEIDKNLKHDMQWVTALMCLVGVCLSIYLTIRQLSK